MLHIGDAATRASHPGLLPISGRIRCIGVSIAARSGGRSSQSIWSEAGGARWAEKRVEGKKAARTGLLFSDCGCEGGGGRLEGTGIDPRLSPPSFYGFKWFHRHRKVLPVITSMSRAEDMGVFSESSLGIETDRPTDRDTTNPLGTMRRMRETLTTPTSSSLQGWGQPSSVYG
eukprot:scaffold147131_cov32-Tisochrysis_lutea.AAC.1